MTNFIDPRLKLRHLQCFLTLASQRSVMKAADALSLTPSAVSKSLAELEDILDVALFVRKRAGLEITPVGELFLDYASQAFGSLLEGVNAIEEGRTVSTAISIGVLPTVASSLLPRAINALCAEYGDTVLTVQTGVNSDLLRQLKLGQLHLVLGRLADPIEMSGVSFAPLYTEPMVFAVRPSHPLAAGMRGAAQIASFPLMLPLRGTAIRRAADSFLIAAGIGMPRQRIESISDSLAHSLLRQSDAIWFGPLGVAADDIVSGLLARLPVATETTSAAVGLSTLTDAAPGAALRFFIGAIRSAAQELQAQAPRDRLPA
jgi:LysR family pca operon transcriptional activator